MSVSLQRPLANSLSPLSEIDQIRTEQAERHLRAFARQAWNVVEPATPFVPGWHIDCICEHLEAVTAHQLPRLVINIPPRHMKSLLVSVFWFAWSWIANPASRWLFNSYADTLSIRDSLKCRRIVESPWFKLRWGDRFSLASDQNMKTRFENDKTGYRIAASVGGANTGEGGDIVVVDDPHNVLTGESDVIREATIGWWNEVMSTRLNDPKTGSKVIVMQRVHESDLSGETLSKDLGYHHLCLPAEYEPRVSLSVGEATEHFQPQPHDECAIYQDPRIEDGDLLWPDRMPQDKLDELKVDLGTYGTAGQLQQRPVPREGAMFKSESFRPLPPEFDQARNGGKTPRQALPRVTYVDLAWSSRDRADYTSAVTVAIELPMIYIVDVWRDRIDEKRLDEELIALFARVETDLAGVELGAFKQAATQDLIVRMMRKSKRPVPIEGVAVTTDKEFRAELPSQRGKAGLIFADRTAPWWSSFEAEMLRFPRGTNDDQVDALSGAVQLAITAGARHAKIKQARFG